MTRVAVTATTVRSTDKAVLLRLEHNDAREVWIPLSELDEDPPAQDRRGVVGLPLWLAEREEIDADPDDAEDEGPDPITVFICRPTRKVIPRKVSSEAFGEGNLVEDKGDRVVVDFPAPHGRKTVLKARVQIQ